MQKIVPFLFSLLLVFTSNVFSQTFTRITDPGNPVVTDQFESGGGSWVDLNKDGWIDLFVANGNIFNQNNALYINNRSGGFIKIFTGPVVNDGGSSIGGTFGDYNNDGNPDLFVTNRMFFKNFLYTGNGDSNFTKIISGNAVTDSANSNSSHWIDIDRDGDLDLHVINFQGNDYLYLNSGAPSFTLTKIDTAAFLMDNAGFSISGVWGDFNNDGFPDLFVGNAGNQNDLIYKNNGNLTFTQSVLSDGRATLGSSWGDYDNDGDLDLFTANYLTQNDYLYRNSGAPGYTFTRIDTGIVSNDGGSSVGSSWGDADNDGDLDLFVANDGQASSLYLNSGAPDYAFTEVASGSIITDIRNSFGAVWADYDNDGDLDLFVANRMNQGNSLYRNEGNSNKWITIRCRGTASGKTATGTKVRVKAVINGTPVWQCREVPAQTGYNSQNLVLHFGLGNAAAIDSIRVEWTSGATTYFTSQAVDRHVTIDETGSIVGINNSITEAPQDFVLYQNYPNPFNPETIINYDLEVNSFITLRIFDIAGKEINSLVNAEQTAGRYSVIFNGKELASGIYFYKLETKGFSETKKMMLVK